MATLPQATAFGDEHGWIYTILILLRLVVVIKRPVPHRQLQLVLIFCVPKRLLFHSERSSYGIVISLMRDSSIRTNPNDVTQNIHLAVRLSLLHRCIRGSIRLETFDGDGTFFVRPRIATFRT